MPTYFIASLVKEESRLPSLFTIGGYRVFFWSNEGDEPVHVHVCKGVPSASSTKVWLTRQGGCIVASNPNKIPASTLKDLLDIISAQHEFICNRWKEFFVTDQITFFC